MELAMLQSLPLSFCLSREWARIPGGPLTFAGFLARRRSISRLSRTSLKCPKESPLRISYDLVTSRAWGSMKDYSLIAFADFLNHDGTSESIVLSDDDKHFSEVYWCPNPAPCY